MSLGRHFDGLVSDQRRHTEARVLERERERERNRERDSVWPPESPFRLVRKPFTGKDLLAQQVPSCSSSALSLLDITRGRVKASRANPPLRVMSRLTNLISL